MAGKHNTMSSFYRTEISEELKKLGQIKDSDLMLCVWRYISIVDEIYHPYPYYNVW